MTNTNEIIDDIIFMLKEQFRDAYNEDEIENWGLKELVLFREFLIRNNPMYKNGYFINEDQTIDQQQIRSYRYDAEHHWNIQDNDE